MYVSHASQLAGVDTAFQRILQEIYKTQTKKQLLSPGGGGGVSADAAAGGSRYTESPNGSQSHLSQGQAIQLHVENPNPQTHQTKSAESKCCQG